MEVYEAIARRRTVRDFSHKKINKNIIKKIIKAGLQAPSNNHLREWEFVLVNDRNIRLQTISEINQNLTLKVSERIINKWGLSDQNQREMYLEAIPKQYKMLLQSSCLIIPCFRQKSPLLKPKTLPDLNGFASIWCCIENMLIAAVSEGIYAVTRIPFEKEIPFIRKVLHIPNEYEIPCYLALGYPQKKFITIHQNNIKLSERIHNNGWKIL